MQREVSLEPLAPDTRRPVVRIEHGGELAHVSRELDDDAPGPHLADALQVHLRDVIRGGRVQRGDVGGRGPRARAHRPGPRGDGGDGVSGQRLEARASRVAHGEQSPAALATRQRRDALIANEHPPRSHRAARAQTAR